MKLNIIIFIIMFMVGACGKDLRRMIGADYNNKTNRIEKAIDGLENRIIVLENRIHDHEFNINMLQQSIDTLEAEDTELLNSMTLLQNNLQTQINDLIAELQLLQNNDSVVEFIDPCGNGPGFDEVILKTASGKLVAYFESGSNRFLSILTPGNYRTTDQQACNFTVTNSGTII